MAGKETAMIELTEQQRRQIREMGWPPEVRDPQTGETFVLIHKEMFQRVRAVLEAEDEIADIEEMYPLATEAAPEDA
jgi:hypothetical protein